VVVVEATVVVVDLGRVVVVVAEGAGFAAGAALFAGLDEGAAFVGGAVVAAWAGDGAAKPASMLVAMTTASSAPVQRRARARIFDMTFPQFPSRVAAAATS
jgi:hypothetical protein